MNPSVFFACVREVLFPAGCAVCGCSLLEWGSPLYGICPSCLRLFRPDPAPRCRLCGRPLLSEKGLCMRCRGLEDPPHIMFSCALYSYASLARDIVRAWKFGRHPMLALFIARSFQAALHQILTMFPQGSFVLVPAPSSPGRWKKTGRDPFPAVVRELSRRSGLPLSCCLLRERSRSQKTLDRRGREENLQGKIRCAGEVPRNAILLDDVITTGATLRCCARALIAGGTERLCCLAFCYD